MSVVILQRQSVAFSKNMVLPEDDEERQNADVIFAIETEYSETHKDLTDLSESEEETPEVKIRFCPNLEEADQSVQIHANVANEEDKQCLQENVDELKDDEKGHSINVRNAVNNDVDPKNVEVFQMSHETSEISKPDERMELDEIERSNKDRLGECGALEDAEVMNVPRKVSNKGEIIEHKHDQESKEPEEISVGSNQENDEENEMYTPTSDESESDDPTDEGKGH